MNEPTLFDTVTNPAADPGQKSRHEFRIAEGRRRRDAGIQQVNANSDDEFTSVCQEAIRYLADKGVPFTSDDVRDLVALEPHHVNCWGAQIQSAVKSGVIVKVGYRQSERPKAHARVIAVYEGASS